MMKPFKSKMVVMAGLETMISLYLASWLAMASVIALRARALPELLLGSIGPFETPEYAKGATKDPPDCMLRDVLAQATSESGQ